jgi:hypothetical protein
MGIPEDQAFVLVLAIAEEQYDCDPGKVPARDMELCWRVCADCAAKAGLEVRPLSGEILRYEQPACTRSL